MLKYFYLSKILLIFTYNMKAIKNNEKTVTVTYREIDIDLSGLR
jgi:hypothetical protein